jgi:hypothetical protein
VPAVVTVRPDRDAATVGFQPMPAAVN